MSALIVAFTLAISMLITAPAVASEKPTIVEFPVAGETFPNPCTGETLTLVSGTFQIVEHTTTDAAGGEHLIVEGNAKNARATSPSGQYRVTGGFWAEMNSGTGRASNFTVTGVLNLVSRGSTDNFALETVFHVTVNASGVPTSLVIGEADGPCRG